MASAPDPMQGITPGPNPEADDTEIIIFPLVRRLIEHEVIKQSTDSHGHRIPGSHNKHFEPPTLGPDGRARPMAQCPMCRDGEMIMWAGAFTPIDYARQHWEGMGKASVEYCGHSFCDTCMDDYNENSRPANYPADQDWTPPCPACMNELRFSKCKHWMACRDTATHYNFDPADEDNYPALRHVNKVKIGYVKTIIDPGTNDANNWGVPTTLQEVGKPTALMKGGRFYMNYPTDRCLHCRMTAAIYMSRTADYLISLNRSMKHIRLMLLNNVADDTWEKEDIDLLFPKDENGRRIQHLPIENASNVVLTRLGRQFEQEGQNFSVKTFTDGTDASLETLLRLMRYEVFTRGDRVKHWMATNFTYNEWERIPVPEDLAEMGDNIPSPVQNRDLGEPDTEEEPPSSPLILR